MGYSCKIYFNKDYIKQDGTCSIYLQVIIDRSKKLFPLNRSWPHAKCEDSQNLCLPRHQGDIQADEVNIILRAAVAKANEIFRYHALADKDLTMDSFKSKWSSKLSSRSSFTEFFEIWITERFRNKEIAYETWKNYNSALNWLKSFRPSVSFMDLNERWAFEFDRHLSRKINSKRSSTQNSRWGYHKCVKAALNHARKVEKMSFEDPYNYFKIAQVTGTWKALTLDEVIKLDQLYRETSNFSYKRILRRFLFSAATSLRVSDLYRVHSSWLNDGILTFKARKTMKFNKTVQIPLSDYAMKLWNEALSEKGDKLLFNDFEEQYSNRVLQEIGRNLGIKTNLHHHVARHTWTTQFLNNGGSVRAAQRILNHSDIKTTMKYDHMTVEDLKKEKAKMEFIK